MKALFKYIFASLMLLSSGNVCGAECEIPMCVIVDKGFANITTETVSVLETQLERLATQSGLDIGWKNSRFILTAKMDQIDRYVVDGAPTQIVNVFGVTFYIADVYNRKVFASTYVEVKGVGTNETKASLNAIRRINLQNGKVGTFMKESKSQIVEYYNKQLPTILKEVKVKSSMKNYEEALAMLAVIPSCCNGYDMAMDEAKKIYLVYRDTYFLSQLNRAKALWASNPSASNSSVVTGILANIDPEARCYNEAMNFLGQVAKTVKEDVDYETKKKYEDAVELEKLRIQAITEIGRAYAANQPKVNIEFLGRGPGIATHHSQTNSSVSSLLPQSMQLSNEKMSGSDIFQRYGTAVFTIEVPSTDGTAYSQGSGFFINNQGLAVSNYHVLEDGNLQKAGIILPGTNTKYSISKVVKANKEDDYVVFIVNCSNNNYIPIANNKPNVGDKVYAIGSPKGFSNTFSSGEVSQWRGPNLMQTTVMIDHGSSGGALINEYGNVVGITSGTFDAESVANLNYAMSIDVIK